MLKLGYKASAEQFGPREMLDFAVHAENVGFDSVFVSDHFQPWRHTDGHASFSLAWLAAVGERTSKVTLGTSVATPTFRYHPAIVAQAFATLGVLYPERILLGVGTGESLNEVPANGMEWPAFKERFARLKEAIDLIRKLWSEDRVSYDGAYYQTKSATIYDRPEALIPIYLAAAGPQSARLAGRIGDGFICTSGKPPELYTEKLLPSVAEGIGKSNQAKPDYENLIEMKVSFDTDRDRAMQDTRHWAALALSPEEKVGTGDPMEMEKLADALPVERAASRWIVSDDPEEHIGHIEPYINMGFSHLVFHAPGIDQIRFLDLYSEQVLPLLRSRYA